MKTTDLGLITVSNDVFAQIAQEALQQDSVRDRIWPAARSSRLLNRMFRFTDPELSKSVKVRHDGQVLHIECSVIVKFGVSIRRVTRAAADYMHDRIMEFLPGEPVEITIEIAGVRSKRVARRSTKAVYHYAAA